MTSKVISKVFWCVILLTGTWLSASSQNAPAGWKTYHSDEFGFTIHYPNFITFYSGRPDYKEIASLSYIPVCDLTTVACFTDKQYGAPNLQAAGLSVNVLRDRRTETECKRIDTGSDPVRTKTINGIHFHYGMTGGAALGHAISGSIYRVFHENVCFELTVWMATTSIGDDARGPIKEFDSRGLAKEFNRIIETFSFTGPVRDGPGWKVYHDSGCGGDFEYPEHAEVKSIPYSDTRSGSNEVTCSDYFGDHGREYTVAAKADLNGQSAVETWLRSSGYPGLSEGQLVKRSVFYTEYQTGPYYYIFGQDTLYILSVSDATPHRVISPKDDALFIHFLNSFRAN